MSTATLSEASESLSSSATKAKFSPIRSLMKMWERDGEESEERSEEESETELMVMLSGMTGQQFFGPDQN